MRSIKASLKADIFISAFNRIPKVKKKPQREHMPFLDNGTGKPAADYKSSFRKSIHKSS